MSFRWMPLLAGLLGLAATAPAAVTPPGPYATVTVEPAKTSIYLGSVSLVMPPFAREGGTYATTYVAKVFPLFFYNEKGQLWIDFSDAELQQLAKGETVNFTGHAHSEDGDERRVEGRVTRTDATTGKIKVRVFVSKRIELIFNTTYRFGNP
jgi:hypothetical protein